MVHSNSVLTLELSRGQRRDTLCAHERYLFKEEACCSRRRKLVVALI